jgi:hypothetical protein
MELAGLYCNRGDAYVGLGEPKFAISDYRHALDLSPAMSYCRNQLHALGAATADELAARAQGEIPNSSSDSPQITIVPADSHPPVPVGLKVTCMVSGTSLTSSLTCPVVRFKGVTTWVYSFIDNRTALAFVSYDANNNVLRNISISGTRYVWQIKSDAVNKSITATAQLNTSVSAPWTQFGP